MIFAQYQQLDQQVDQLFNQAQYDQALTLLDQAQGQFPQNSFDIGWYRAVIYAQTQQWDVCLETIRSLIDQGFSCPLDWGWFDPLRSRPDYHSLEQLNQQLVSQAQKQAKMKYKVHLPADFVEGQAYPLFIALHGDGGGGNLADFSWRWKAEPLTAQHFIVVYAQSSQVLYTNNHGWLADPATARKDVYKCYQIVSEKYIVDPEKIFIGGFSGGAITAVDVALAGELPIKGFVALCPELKPEHFTPENVAQAAQRGVKGVFMEGELVMPVADEEEMLAAFEQTGLPCKLVINRKAGHWFPDDLTAKLEDAVSYVLS